MYPATTMRRVAAWLGSMMLAGITLSTAALSQTSATTVPLALTTQQMNVIYGPYNASFLQGGLGLTKTMHEHSPLAAAQRSWSMSLWLKTNEQNPTALVAGVGRPAETSPRYLALKDGKPAFWAGGAGEGHELVG